MFEFSCNILQKNPKELCGQPNNVCPSLEPFSFILWFPATSTPHTGCCSPGAFKLHWPAKTQVSLTNTMTTWVCPCAFCHPNIQHTHSWNEKLMKQCFILKTGGGIKKKKTGKFHSPLKDCHAYFEKRQYEKWSQDLGSYRNGFESQGSYLLYASYPRNLSIPQLQNESNGNFIAGDSCRVKWRQICENAQGMTDRTIVSST